MPSLLNLLFSLLIYSTHAPADETVVVTGTHLDAEEPEPEASITVIRADEIRRRGTSTLGELLKTEMGATIVQGGGPGQSSSFFIRGAESHHTLVIVDGIEMNEPSNPSRGFDFSSFSTENIERIEIYEGPQSVRFGSDAVGGVVNVITNSGHGSPSGTYLLEAGKYRSRQVAASLLGGKNRLKYSFAGSVFQNQGFSAADEKLGNTEPDSYRRYSLSSRLGWDFSPRSNIDFTMRTLDSKSQLDISGGPNGDDPNYDLHVRQTLLGTTFRTRNLDDHLASSLGVYFVYTDRADENLPDAKHVDVLKEHFFSDRLKIETRHEYLVSSDSTVEALVQWRQERARESSFYNGVSSDLSENVQSDLGAALKHKYQRDRWSSEMGVREDWQSQFSSLTNFSFSPAYLVPAIETTLRVRYGTGFKTPSLYQIYSSYGSHDLRAERSRSGQISLEKKLAAKSEVSIVYFKNTYYDLIDFNPITLHYSNTAKASSYGYELKAVSEINQGIQLRGTYAALASRDEATGLSLLRRPIYTWSLGIVLTQGRAEVSFDYFNMGSREDIDPISFRRTKLASYDIVSAAVSYRLLPILKIFSRAENLLDRQYEGIAGYGSSRFATYWGLMGEF